MIIFRAGVKTGLTILAVGNVFFLFYQVFKFPGNDIITNVGNVGNVTVSNIVSSTVTPLSKLTRSHINDVECPGDLVPLYDRIVKPLNTDEQKIPRVIHLAWIRGYSSPQSRCISKDMMDIPLNWMKRFPSYSIYFHDDEAVDTLLNKDWPEFPQLNKMMKACVKYGSAMRIDIWRILVLYRYGGFYSDFDVSPGENLTESLVEANDTAFFLSDVSNRPSQWLFGMESNHPIAYHTMLQIFSNLLELKDVSLVKLVKLTGPEALRRGYSIFLENSDRKDIYGNGTHTGKLGKVVRKITYENMKLGYVLDRYVVMNLGEKVPFPRNSTTLITRQERIEIEMKTTHWKEVVKKERRGMRRGKCTDHLYMNDNNLTMR